MEGEIGKGDNRNRVQNGTETHAEVRDTGKSD